MLNKKITINLSNVEFTRDKENAIHLKISSNSFVYLKKNTQYINELSYVLLNPCDVTTGVRNNAIALSDTQDSYTRCTYGSSIYVVTNPIESTYADDVIAFSISNTIFAIPTLIAKLQVTEQVNSLSEQVNSLSEQVTELSTSILDAKVTVRDWDWSGLIGQSFPASGECIVPIPIPTSGYINVSFYPRNLASDANFKLYNKNQEGKYQEQSVLYTIDKSEISASILSLVIPTKVEIGDTELYFGCDNCRFYGSAAEGDFVLLANNSSYKGLLLSYSLVGDTSKELSSLSEQVTEMEDEIQVINDKLEELALTDNERIEEKEYWIRVQGNTFDSSELFLGNGATTFDNSVLLSAATSYVALNKIYWSNRRIHKFIVTPTTLGTLVINLAQNTSNAMYPTFTGGNWTSAFKIDFSNKKIYMGDNIEFDMSSMNIVAGGKYIIELKYIKRVFYVTITDFLNYDSYTAMLDARDSNKNGGFKNTLVIQNQSGNYTVEQIETYEVANPTLVLFGDSVTEAIGRVGKGQNYSEIISEKIKSCTIIAQGGAGTGSWNNIFENEIKHIKPKYCSFHMGLNGGFNSTQLEKFITDCESIGTIPILNHVICTTQMSTGNTQETYNSVLDGVVNEKGYMGYYGDIATATNNDIASQSNYYANNAGDGKFNIKKTAMSKDCFNTYTIAEGKTVIEDEEERVLDSPLEVIMDIHPKAAGHEVMADRYLKEIKI